MWYPRVKCTEYQYLTSVICLKGRQNISVHNCYKKNYHQSIPIGYFLFFFSLILFQSLRPGTRVTIKYVQRCANWLIWKYLKFVAWKNKVAQILPVMACEGDRRRKSGIIRSELLICICLEDCIVLCLVLHWCQRLHYSGNHKTNLVKLD